MKQNDRECPRAAAKLAWTYSKVNTTHTHTHFDGNECVYGQRAKRKANESSVCVCELCMRRILCTLVVKTNHSEIRTIISLFTLLYSVSFEHKERELERYLFAVSFCWIVLSSFPFRKMSDECNKKIHNALFVRSLAPLVRFTAVAHILLTPIVWNERDTARDYNNTLISTQKYCGTCERGAKDGEHRRQTEWERIKRSKRRILCVMK